MEPRTNNIFEALERFVKVSHQYPGMAFLLGLIVGLFTREIIELADILNLWLRRIMTGDRRKKNS